MMEMNFELAAVDDLLRGPGDWNAGTRGCHDHQIAIVPAFQKFDVAVMRQNFWPQFQVGCCFEDHHLRRLYKDRVYSVHGMAASDGNPLGQRCCATSAEQWTVPRKAFLRKRKIVRQASENKLSLAEMNLPIRNAKAGVRTLTFDSDLLSRRISLKNRVWRRPLVVPVGSYT